ncbi:NYN domain-containing protein [Micromonospora pattaloongensis]|nr:NYN domain-containing protein [Micromonospora pattaloongensis]
MRPTPLLIVDAANVVGSRPDGWWRDRPGATRRLRDALAGVATAGLPPLPAPLDVVLVVEGAARGVPGSDGVRVVPAPRSGDDAIVALVAAEAPRRPVVVVTADRELRGRIAALGAQPWGPRTLDAVRDAAADRSAGEPPD